MCASSNSAEEGTERRNREVWTLQASNDSWTAVVVDGVVFEKVNQRKNNNQTRNNHNSNSERARGNRTHYIRHRKRALVLLRLLTEDEEVNPPPSCTRTLRKSSKMQKGSRYVDWRARLASAFNHKKS